MNSIEKTLSMLRALAQPGGPHQLADLSAFTGMTRPSAHRILQTLVESNYAQAHRGGLYSAGLAMRALAAREEDGASDLANAARPVLSRLQQETGHTVHFAARAGDAAVYLAKFEGDKAYRMASRVGMPIRLHTTSIGKAMLATMPTEEVEAILDRTGAFAQGSRAAEQERFLADLNRVRDLGYAVDDEENEANVRCVGAVVRDSRGTPVAGVSISGLTFAFPIDDIARLGPLVRNTAGEVSRIGGYIR